MGRKKKILSKIKLTGIADKGKAVGRAADGRVGFVEGGAAPGDVVDIQVRKRNKRHFVGFPIHYHEYSPNRVTPFCEHFDDCGGCKWQHLEYKAQLRHKEQMVVDVMRRIAKIPEVEVATIIGADPIYHYRNKMEFSFSKHRYSADKNTLTTPYT